MDSAAASVSTLIDQDILLISDIAHIYEDNLAPGL